MPTYEYECTHCNHLFERFQNMSAEPLKRCPKCRHKIKRLVGTGAGIIFKGSGFYETDYRSDGYRSEAKRDSASSSSDSSSKTDSKKKTDGKKKTKKSTDKK
jgi:putative FmdB family regulatory protein